jgi:hypothetical protein
MYIHPIPFLMAQKPVSSFRITSFVCPAGMTQDNHRLLSSKHCSFGYCPILKKILGLYLGGYLGGIIWHFTLARDYLLNYT